MHYTVQELRRRKANRVDSIRIINNPITIKEFPTIDTLSFIVEDGDNVMRIDISGNNGGQTTITVKESSNNSSYQRNKWSGYATSGPLVERGLVHIMYEEHDLSTPIAVAAALKD